MSARSLRPRPLLFRIAFASCAIIGLACGTSGSAPSNLQTLGFLEDYEQLAPGSGDQARLLFIDEAADFSAYERVIIDRVVAWNGGADEEALALGFDAVLRKQLASEFDVVEGPGADTLRLRCAVAMKAPSLLGIEIEVLDAASDARLVAAVDERRVPDADHDRARAQREVELTRWAEVIRDRLATFRSFDAAQRTRGEDAD